MVELEVKNGTELQANEKTLFYVAMLPRESRPVDITVETQDGKCYETSYTPKDMKAGYAYRWSITPEYAGDHVGVDLGLPSGLKWATMNVGARTAEGNGTLYSWGETLPKDVYSYKNYKWGTLKSHSGSGTLVLNLTRYTCDDGSYKSIWYSNNTFIGDGITTLLPEDDAATQNWGSKWRMPTVDDCNELIENCDWHIDFDYCGTSVWGYVATGKNGNSIFIPFNKKYSDIYGGDWSGGYFIWCWTSTICLSNSNKAVHLGSGYYPSPVKKDPAKWPKKLNVDKHRYRCEGTVIRAVCK